MTKDVDNCRCCDVVRSKTSKEISRLRNSTTNETNEMFSNVSYNFDNINQASKLKEKRFNADTNIFTTFCSLLKKFILAMIFSLILSFVLHK